jgi:hypothetical protein
VRELITWMPASDLKVSPEWVNVCCPEDKPNCRYGCETTENRGWTNIIEEPGRQ